MPITTRNRSSLCDNEWALMTHFSYDKNSLLDEKNPLRKHGWESYTDVIEYRLSENPFLNSIKSSLSQPLKRALAFVEKPDGYYAKVIVNREKKLVAVLTAGTQSFLRHEDGIPNLLSDAAVLARVRPDVLKSSEEFVNHVREMMKVDFPGFEMIHIGQSLGGYISTYNAAVAGEIGIGLDAPGSGHLLTDAQKDNAKKTVFYFQCGDENVVNVLNPKIGNVFRYVIDGSGIDESIRGGLASTHPIDIALKSIDPNTGNFKEVIYLGQEVESNLISYTINRLSYESDFAEYQERVQRSVAFNNGEPMPLCVGKNFMDYIGPPVIPPKPISSDYTHQSKVGDGSQRQRREAELKKEVYERFLGHPSWQEHDHPRILPTPIESDSFRHVIALDVDTHRVQTNAPSIQTQAEASPAVIPPQAAQPPVSVIQNSIGSSSRSSSRPAIEAPQVLAPHEVSLDVPTNSVYGFKGNHRSFSSTPNARDAGISPDVRELQNFITQAIPSEYSGNKPLFENKQIEFGRKEVKWSGNSKNYDVSASAEYLGIAGVFVGGIKQAVHHMKKSKEDVVIERVESNLQNLMTASHSKTKKLEKLQDKTITSVKNARAVCKHDSEVQGRLDAIEYGVLSKDPLLTSTMGQREIDIDLDDRIRKVGQKLDENLSHYAFLKAKAIEAFDSAGPKKLDDQYKAIPARAKERYEPLDRLIENTHNSETEKQLYEQARANGDGEYFQKIQALRDSKNEVTANTPTDSDVPVTVPVVQKNEPKNTRPNEMTELRNGLVSVIQLLDYITGAYKTLESNGLIGSDESMSKGIRQLEDMKFRTSRALKLYDDTNFDNRGDITSMITALIATEGGELLRQYFSDDNQNEQIKSLNYVSYLSSSAKKTIVQYSDKVAKIPHTIYKAYVHSDQISELAEAGYELAQHTATSLAALATTATTEEATKTAGAAAAETAQPGILSQICATIGPYVTVTNAAIVVGVAAVGYGSYCVYYRNDDPKYIEYKAMALVHNAAVYKCKGDLINAEKSITDVFIEAKMEGYHLFAFSKACDLRIFTDSLDQKALEYVNTFADASPELYLMNSALNKNKISTLMDYAVGLEKRYQHEIVRVSSDPLRGSFSQQRDEMIGLVGVAFYKMLNEESFTPDDFEKASFFISSERPEFEHLADISIRIAYKNNIFNELIEQCASRNLGRPGEVMAEIYLMRLMLSSSEPRLSGFFTIAAEFESRSQREIDTLSPDSNEAGTLNEGRLIMARFLDHSFSIILAEKNYSRDIYQYAARFSKVSTLAQKYSEIYDSRRKYFHEHLGFKAIDIALLASSNFVESRLHQRLTSIVSASRSSLSLFRNPYDLPSAPGIALSYYHLGHRFSLIPNDSNLHGLARYLRYCSSFLSVASSGYQLANLMQNVRTVDDLGSVDVVSVVNDAASALWPLFSNYIPDGPNQNSITSSNYLSFMRRGFVKRIKNSTQTALTVVSESCYLYRHRDLVDDLIHDAGYTWGIQQGAEFALKLGQMATVNNLFPVGMWTFVYTWCCIVSRHQNTDYIAFVTQCLLHNARIYYQMGETDNAEKCLVKILRKSPNPVHHKAALILANDFGLKDKVINSQAYKEINLHASSSTSTPETHLYESALRPMQNENRASRRGCLIL